MGTSLSGPSLSLPYTSAELRICGRQPSGTPKKLHQKRTSGERERCESGQWAGEDATCNYAYTTYIVVAQVRRIAHAQSSSSQLHVRKLNSIVRLALVTSVACTPPFAPPVRFCERRAANIQVERSAARPHARSRRPQATNADAPTAATCRSCRSRGDRRARRPECARALPARSARTTT